MKKLNALLLCAILSVSAYAVPAKRGVIRSVTQADGSSLTLHLRGDETFHYYTDSQGQAFRQDANGNWMPDFRDVKARWSAAKAKRNNHRTQLAQRVHRAMKAPARVGEPTGGTGIKKGLLILVNFKDKKMVNGDQSQAIFNQMLNAIGNPYGDNYGSVREYFQAQSYGQFDIEFDVVGPVTMSQKMSYYGSNDFDGNDKAAEQMIVEACKLVDSEVNFADYDWDGDGEVENIYVTYAGYSEASGADENTIWPHQWQLSEADISLELDGVKIDTYACGSELFGTLGSTIDGIGTMCHEYSHCLGLPDFYDTDYSGACGMFDWDIMDSGCYNGGGFCPAAYTAYEREYCGWLTYTELTPDTRITDMPNIEDNAVAYIIRNDAHPDEYYVLANYQQKGWNAMSAGHGLLILHVDYKFSVWVENGPNDDPSHQRMTIIPADNKYDFETYEGEKYYYANDGDTYPGSKSNNELTDASKPAAKLHNANTDGSKYMHKPITDITEMNGLISFHFMKEPVFVEMPVIDETQSSVNDTAINLVWNAVEGAASYNVHYSYTLDPEGGQETEDDETVLNALQLWEDFEGFIAESDGSHDVSDKLDTYTTDEGWTGAAVYKGIYGAKLASGKKAGFLTTPPLSCESGEVTLYLLAYKWVNSSGEDDQCAFTVSLLNSTGVVKTTQDVTLGCVGSNEYKLIQFSNVPASYKITFSTSKGRRVYMADLLAFDGIFTSNQIESLFESTDPTGTSGSHTYTGTTVSATNTFTLTDEAFQTGMTITVTVQTVDAEGNLSAWSTPVAFTIEKQPGGVNSLTTADALSAETYDLTGRRVNTALRKGIYIRGGQKIFVQ